MSSSRAPAPVADPLTSCVLIPQRIHENLSNNAGLILHRSQWQCLALSYSVVLQALTQVLQHASQDASSSLTAALGVLHGSMLEGENCMVDCIASFSQSWLLDKALKLGPSTDVVDVHLHRFLWAFSMVFDIVLNIIPQTDHLESDLIQLMTSLSDIWACTKAKDDLSSACDFLNAIKCREEVDSSCLAEFILLKLSHAQELENVPPDVLPAYLWVDSESLQRNPEVLGVGGYGKVHEVVWLGGHFAVKDFFYVENNEVFGREAAIQARLRHPNVIPLVSCTKKSSSHIFSLVMELMQEDLRVLMLKRIEAGMSPPFSLGLSVDLMLQIAQGMEYLHGLHIMHRDLKSSNILVTYSRDTCNDVKDVCPFPHLKIADFGMSKAKQASSKYTTKQVGATSWRAPEVFENNPEADTENFTDEKYTKKADVYSFGLVCYEILTGNFPFEGTQVRRRVLAGERPTLPSYCPRALSSYLESCWSAEPSNRPPFSQICRVLRYLKACVLLQEHHHSSPSHFSWLSQPLTHIVCAHIDDMVRSFMQPRGTPFQPQPVNIPLEMYCCRTVLQRRADIESFLNNRGHSESGTTIIETKAEFNASQQKNFILNRELQQGQGKFKWKTKDRVSRWLQKHLCLQGSQSAKSEFQSALGLVRDFSWEELQIATFHFSKIIGKGGNGKVYYGKLEDGQEIAVKVALWPEGLQIGSPISGNASILQELRIASRLQHRNIVPLFGWCQARQRLYLVYEFMPNGDLASHIFGVRSHPSLNWKQRYKISCQLASALKYLHQDSGYLQIVHRDVKANNVLLDLEWNVRLGDCGLALLLRDGDNPWPSLAGTVGYIAPECAAHGRVSTALDVYAFGVTILELVSGRRACSYDAASETYFVRDWAWELFHRGDLIKVADKRLGGEFNKMELKRLLLLGLSCTSADPHLRPRTDELLGILSGASEPLALRDRPMQFPYSVNQSYSNLGTSSSSTLWHSHIPSKSNRESSPSRPEVRFFLYKELKLATKGFRIENKLGEGGFGVVYKGSINEAGHNDNRLITVAVKVLGPGSMQGRAEWLAEVFFLGRLHHPHLIKLIGLCSEDVHHILVYEFMPNGSLKDYLFKKKTPQLDWKIRMKIALGAAKGLAFLHGGERAVLFRDLHPSNILLDADYTAKLSDFGFARLGPSGDSTHVSTRVMGTYGYTAPEYVATGHLTWRSDVYSFGVVLLELIMGRQAVDLTRPQGEQYLAEWARPYLRNKQGFQKIIDPSLNGVYSIKEVHKAVSLAYNCLELEPKRRPFMNDVVQTLETLQSKEERVN